MSSFGFHCHDVKVLEETIVGNGLRRGEFYNLDPETVPELRKQIDRHKLAWSIHSPLIKLDWYPTPPTWSYFCDFSKENRELTKKMVSLTVDHAEEFGAGHVVAHFPTPSSDAAGEDQGKLESIAMKSAEWLANLSVKKNVPIHIEGVGASPLLRDEFLTRALTDFTPLRYCFDTAHVYLSSLADGFDYYGLAAAVSPFLGSVHVWNTRGRDDYDKFRHIPVHPSQAPEEGWVDIPKALKALKAARDSVAVIFEAGRTYPKELGGYDYRDGIKWVTSLLKT